MPGLDVARYTLRHFEDDGYLTTFYEMSGSSKARRAGTDDRYREGLATHYSTLHAVPSREAANVGAKFAISWPQQTLNCSSLRV